MLAELVNHDGNEVTVQFTVKLTGSMLDDEQALFIRSPSAWMAPACLCTKTAGGRPCAVL